MRLGSICVHVFLVLVLCFPALAQGDKNYSAEEIAIIAQLDSLTGKAFEGRFQLPLVEKQDSIARAKETLPRFSDTVLTRNILAIQSEIPLAFNDRVRRYIEVYGYEKREKTEIILGLSEMYFPIFEEELDRRNLPHHLKYLPVVESALNANAVSRAGATGLWQLMYSTGRMLGCNINSYVDERRDPYRSTTAALDYLQRMYNVYGDWLLTIAAYNCGPGNVNKAIARAGGERNFWKMQHYLPAETRGYVPAFLGAMYVFMHYKDFELKPIMPKYVCYPTDTVIVYKKVGLAHLATHLNIENEELEYLNPSLKKNMVPVTSTGYALKLPVSKMATYVALEDSIFKNMPDPEQELVARSQVTASQNSVSSSGSSGKSKLYYTVKSGDNLGYISEWYDVTVQQIRNWNGMYSNTIRVGQKLTIYVPKEKYDHYYDLNSMSQKEKQEWKAGGGTTHIKKDASCNCVYYKVRAGDTLWDISQKYRVGVESIKKENKISSNDLKVGQVLKITFG